MIAVIVSIDMRKAFDSIHREYLLQKLKNKYGISDIWLRSYLQDRYQFVDINGNKSAHRNTLIGLPAGSVLAGILFTLYINDLPEVIYDGRVIMFMDDSNIIFVGSSMDLDNLRSRIEADMTKVTKYFMDNLLTINKDKTKMITISTSRKLGILNNFSFMFEGTEIKGSETLKCLGLTFDRQMSWRNHIDNCAKICYIRIRALYKIRDMFTIEQLRTLGNALVLSVLNYMLVVTGATNYKYIKIMDKVVRALGRLILRVRKYDSIAEKIKIDLEWMFTSELYQYRILCNMFKICKLDNVPIFKNCFKLTVSHHDHNTRGICKYAYTYNPKLEFGKRVFEYKGVQLWNKLPEKIRTIQSYSIFKKELCNLMCQSKSNGT